MEPVRRKKRMEIAFSESYGYGSEETWMVRVMMVVRERVQLESSAPRLLRLRSCEVVARATMTGVTAFRFLGPKSALCNFSESGHCLPHTFTYSFIRAPLAKYYQDGSLKTKREGWCC